MVLTRRGLESRAGLTWNSINSKPLYFFPSDPTTTPPMKILETQSAILSNYEVLSHLTATRAKPRTAPQKHSNVDTVLKEVKLPPPSSSHLTLKLTPLPPQLTGYLSPPPTSRSPIPRYQNRPYSDAAVRALVAALRPYNLTKSEVLMVVNLRPEELGLLDCVVEECDERFTAERQDEILKVIGDVLGRGGGDGGEEGTNGVHGEAVNGRGMDGEGAREDGPL